MPTKREQVLVALEAVLKTIETTVTDVEVFRNLVLPPEVPDGGLVVLRDGDPGDPEIVLSPVTYQWEHVAEIEIIVAEGEDAARTTALDDILAAIGVALKADRTLGGAVDEVRAEPPVPEDEGIEGAPAVRGLVLPVTLYYDSPDPLE